MIETARLVLRPWREKDVAPFHAMGQDPEVMRYLNGVVGHDEIIAMIQRQREQQDRTGHCFWAVERREDSEFIGFCGLRLGGHPETGVENELEIGWRLARAAWGQGYAREAAAASIAWGWANTARARIAAWTVPGNSASWGLMRRLGMIARPELDFDHPMFPSDHPLSRHLVYTIDRPLDEGWSSICEKIRRPDLSSQSLSPAHSCGPSSLR